MRKCLRNRSSSGIGCSPNTVREDILMSLEYHDLEDSQARALLKSDKPLKQIFERWENQETSYMDTVWDTVQEQARAAEAKQKAKAQKER